MANASFDPNENIIAKLGLGDLPEEKRAELLDRMAQLVEKRVILRLMEALSEQDAAEAEKLADKPEELLAFMASKVPDIGAVIAEETEKVQKEIILSAGVGSPSAE